MISYNDWNLFISYLHWIQNTFELNYFIGYKLSVVSLDYVRHLTRKIRFGGSRVRQWGQLGTEGYRHLVHPVAGWSVCVGFRRHVRSIEFALSTRDALDDWIQIRRHADGVVTGRAFYHFGFWLYSTEDRKTRRHLVRSDEFREQFLVLPLVGLCQQTDAVEANVNLSGKGNI